MTSSSDKPRACEIAETRIADRNDPLPMLLTPRALAKLLHISTRTLDRRRADGGFIAFRMVGRRILYASTDVLAHLESVKSMRRAESKRG